VAGVDGAREVAAARPAAVAAARPAVKARHRSRGMNLTALFIRRPVMTTLLMTAILTFGVIGYRQLPVSDLPTVDYPTLSVGASLPGASPETMAATVATPLEKAFSGIAGIDEITSNSSLGSTNITLTFSLDRDIESAAQDVNAAIGKTLPFLPPNLLPPNYHKQNPSAAPILNIALTSNELSVQDIDEYAETTIAQRLSMIEGVAQVNVYGSAKYAVRVQLDPAKLASLGIGVSQVAAQIRLNNVMLPTGVLYGKDRTVTIQATGQMSNAAEFRRLIVTWKNGAPVRLGDLGNVLDDIQNNKNMSFYNGERTINLMINRQPGTNTVEVANKVKVALSEIEKGLPTNLSVHLQFDRSIGIQHSVNDVKRSLLIALCLVVMVIFVFLRNIVATLIPSLTLPMAIVGTFSIMALLSFSIDNISLMALTMAVGFLVDDAIVMLENVYRHLEMGKRPLQAALDGAKEIGSTIVSMTLSLGAVFIPLAFMGGIIGRLFREFAITIMVAVLVSGFVSLTLTPMLCSRMLRPHDEVQHGRWYRASDRLLQRAREAYLRSLGGLLSHRWIAVAFSLLIVALTATLWTVIPKGLFPPDDTGTLNGTIEAAQGTSFQDMVRYQRIAMERLKSDTNIASFTCSVGGGMGSGNQLQLNVTLKPLGQRPPADVMVRELTARFRGIPGLQAFFTNPPSIQIGGRGSKTAYQFTLRGSNIERLYSEALKFMVRLQDEPLLAGVTSNLLNTAPIVRVHIDRQRALSLGVTPLAIENALANAYNQQQVSTIYTPTNEYWVVMETVPSAQLDAAALEQFFVPGNGKMIPLTDVAYFERLLGPLSIPHSGQMASVTISFNLAAGASLGAAVDQVNKIAKATLPGTITTGFSGTAQAFQASQQNLGLLLIITVFIIYLILGVLYESFIHPLTILTGLPFAAFGALLALTITKVELGVYGYVGIIMLLGIVQKNAIMMIDFAIAIGRASGLRPAEAMMQAARVRFRPIMMTTFSAIIGTLPIAIGVGASAASRRPLGIAVVGGLVFSQIVTLFVTPVYYTYMDEFQAWLGRRVNKPRAATLEPGLVPAMGRAANAPD
jgi:HAE1 family hydrophobic/amphiphilic exporter-1